MKRLSLIALLLMTFLLVACERPSPEGSLQQPEGNGEIILPETEGQPETGAEEGAIEGEGTDPATDTGTEEGTGEEVGSEEAGAEEGAVEGETSDPGTEEGAGAETGNEEAGDDSEEAPPPLEDGVYAVQSGDTLGQIAFIFGISLEDLMAANGLTNPDVLDVGQELTIPEAGFADTQPADDGSSDEGDSGDSEPAEEQTYIVRAGDTLFNIGQYFGITVDELAEYNSITDINSLDVGQELKIPPASGE